MFGYDCRIVYGLNNYKILHIEPIKDFKYPLDKRITIERYVNDASVGYDEHYDWQLDKTTFANIFTRNGTTQFNQQTGDIAITTTEITIRADKYVDGNKYYKIIAQAYHENGTI